MIRRVTLLPILIAIYSGITSCSEDETDFNVAIYQNVVTFIGNGPATANFTYREIDDSPLVTLCVRGSLDTTRVHAGSRLLMTYSLPDGIANGADCYDVTLRGLQTIYTDTVSIVPAEEASAANAPIYLSTLYRTGHYLNLYCSMPALSGRKYFLMADESTLDSDTASLYLSTRVKESIPSYNATQVASIDISPVWDRPGVRAVAVRVNNTNNPYRTIFTFTKPPLSDPISHPSPQ